MTPDNGGHHFKAVQFPAAKYIHANVKPGDKEAPVVLVSFAATMVRVYSHSCACGLTQLCQMEYALKNWAGGKYDPLDLKGREIRETYWRHVDALKATGEQDPNRLSGLLWYIYKQARYVLPLPATYHRSYHILRAYQPPQASREGAAPTVTGDAALFGDM